MNRCIAALLALGALGGLVNDARADGPIALHFGGASAKITRAVCAQKAVEAMGTKEKFTFAEITPDGNARGWNDKAAVLVISTPTPNKEVIAVTVVVATHDNDEAARLRDIIRVHICEGPHNPDAPKHVAPQNGTVPAAPVSLSWKSAQRPVVSVARHFEPVACVVLEKRGFSTNVTGKGLVFGGTNDGMVLTFLAPTTNALATQFNVVTATHDAVASATLADELLSRIVRILYED